VNYKVKILSL